MNFLNFPFSKWLQQLNAGFQILHLSWQVRKLTNQGLAQEAISLASQTCDLLQKSFGENWIYALSLQSLADIHSGLGNYTKAEGLYRQALEIFHQSWQKSTFNDLPMTSLARQRAYTLCLLGFCEIYLAVHEYNEILAESLFKDALQIISDSKMDNHPVPIARVKTAKFLVNLAFNTSEFEANILLEKALEIMPSNAKSNPDYTPILADIALQIGGDDYYERCESYLTNSIGVFVKQGMLDQPEFALMMMKLASLDLAKGNYAHAEKLIQTSLEILHKTVGENCELYAEGLRTLAHLFAATGRASEALASIKKVAELEDREVGQVFCLSSEKQRMAYVEKIQKNLFVFYSLVYQYLSSFPEYKKVAFDLVLRRKAIAAEALATQRDAVLGGRYPELKEKLQRLANLKMKIAQKTLAGAWEEDLAQHEKILAHLEQQKEEIDNELARQIPEMNLKLQLMKVDSYQVASKLKEATLIEFVRFDVYNFKAIPARGEEEWQSAQYLAFIMLTDEPENVQMINLGEAEPIDRAITKFRTSITGEAEHRGFETVERELIPGLANGGIDLRRKIFDPLLEAIGDRNRLFIAPDGDLNKLPFEVLPTDDGNRLIDKYHISYLGTARDALRFGVQSKGKPAEPLVIADPDFDLGGEEAIATEHYYGKISRDFDQRALNFQPLPGTRKEGEHIAKMLNLEPWFKGEVLEARLKAKRSPRILHIATHGFFLKDQKRDLNQEHFGNLDRLSGANLENPLLRSGLALAGANTWLKKSPLPPEAEDGILTAEDVSGLDLLDTELVVLSACETGLGEVQTGEGVFGLRRAFVLAGAKTLVMSLWKVSDQQTEELMTDYYRRILAGEPRGEALRSAQLEMKQKYPNSIDWGAFICQGEISPLLQQ